MNASPSAVSPAEQIDAILAKFGGWRGEKLAQVRSLIKQADPEVTEDIKWKTASNPDGIPVWYHNGILLTGEIYKEHLRLGFAKGPALKDPKGLINSYRAIIVKEEDELNETAFKGLIREAVKLNNQTTKAKSQKN